MRIKLGARRLIAVGLVVCMPLAQVSVAQEAIDESPNPFAMGFDLIVARPLGVVLVAAGAAVWVVSLPFTLLAGHTSEAAGALIGGPVEATFMRCLGCRNPGYTGKDAELAERKKAEQAEEAEQAAVDGE